MLQFSKEDDRASGCKHEVNTQVIGGFNVYRHCFKNDESASWLFKTPFPSSVQLWAEFKLTYCFVNVKFSLWYPRSPFLHDIRTIFEASSFKYNLLMQWFSTCEWRCRSGSTMYKSGKNMGKMS